MAQLDAESEDKAVRAVKNRQLTDSVQSKEDWLNQTTNHERRKTKPKETKSQYEIGSPNVHSVIGQLSPSKAGSCPVCNTAPEDICASCQNRLVSNAKIQELTQVSSRKVDLQARNQQKQSKESIANLTPKTSIDPMPSCDRERDTPIELPPIGQEYHKSAISQQELKWRCRCNNMNVGCLTCALCQQPKSRTIEARYDQDSLTPANLRKTLRVPPKRKDGKEDSL